MVDDYLQVRGLIRKQVVDGRDLPATPLHLSAHLFTQSDFSGTLRR
jgi:hypothetical protein